MNKALNLLVQLDDVLDFDMMLGTPAKVSMILTQEAQSVILKVSDVLMEYHRVLESIDGLKIDLDTNTIISPGKFEGQMHYVPYYWDQFLNGFGNDCGVWVEFRLDNIDKMLFPELLFTEYLYLSESNNGFVGAERSPEKRTVDDFPDPF